MFQVPNGLNGLPFWFRFTSTSIVNFVGPVPVARTRLLLTFHR